MVKVSIIVPVYSSERYLATCIKSLTNQTLKDIEIILVDDGSPDNCPKLCDQYAEKDPRIKVLHKKNEGPGLTRNAGMKIATGEFVAFCDSDDYVAPNTYEVCYKIARQTNADEVRFLMSRFSNNDKIIDTEVATKPRVVTTCNHLEITDALVSNIAPILHDNPATINSNCSSCTAIYKTKVIRENNIQFQSERLVVSEDYLFNIEFADICNSVAFTENRFYYYRHNDDSWSMKFHPGKLEKTLSFFPYFSEALKQVNYPEAETFAAGIVFCNLFAYLKLLFRQAVPIKTKKKWFYETIDFNELKNLTKNYPFSKIGFAKRLRFAIIMTQNFWLCYAFEVIKNLLLTFRKE